MGVDLRFGGAVFRDHRPCNLTPLPFRKTGLRDFNFVRDDVMLVRSDADAGMCHQLCKQDVRCDAVEISDTECTMYHQPFYVKPKLKKSRGIQTVFVNQSPELGLTRAEALRSLGDPADHSSGDEGVVAGRPLQEVYLRVWDQRSEDHGPRFVLQTIHLQAMQCSPDALHSLEWAEWVRTALAPPIDTAIPSMD
eukprot:jgi/Tetstr1/433418/TSEL_022692.t1